MFNQAEKPRQSFWHSFGTAREAVLVRGKQWPPAPKARQAFCLGFSAWLNITDPYFRDLQQCDLLLVDVHQFHGNTPINKIDEDAKRVSLVMYYRKNMISCGSAEEEMNIVKRRQKGTHLN